MTLHKILKLLGSKFFLDELGKNLLQCKCIQNTSPKRMKLHPERKETVIACEGNKMPIQFGA